MAKKSALSDAVILANYGAESNIKRLTGAHYMSPQDSTFTGEGFCCKNCDHRGGDLPRVSGEGIAWCNHPEILTPVEKRACCNYFRYDGVST